MAIFGVVLKHKFCRWQHGHNATQTKHIHVVYVWLEYGFQGVIFQAQSNVIILHVFIVSRQVKP